MNATPLHTFTDRADAGRQLADSLSKFAGERNLFILAFLRAMVDLQIQEPPPGW